MIGFNLVICLVELYHLIRPHVKHHMATAWNYGLWLFADISLRFGPLLPNLQKLGLKRLQFLPLFLALGSELPLLCLPFGLAPPRLFLPFRLDALPFQPSSL